MGSNTLVEAMYQRLRWDRDVIAKHGHPKDLIRIDQTIEWAKTAIRTSRSLTPEVTIVMPHTKRSTH